MSRMVIRADRDPHVDLYLVWSSIVDDAIFAGTREQVTADLMREGTELGRAYTDGDIERFFDRADQYGSSSSYKDAWWQADGLVCRGCEDLMGEDRWSWWIPREHLAGYARVLLQDDRDKVAEFLRSLPELSDAEDDDL